MPPTPPGWEHESSSSNNRYKNISTYDAAPLTANGTELDFTRGLLFTIGASDAVRVDIKGKRMAMNKVLTITLKDLKAGHKVTVKCKTSKSGTGRGINVTNLTPESGSFNSTSADDQTNVATVTADGDVTLTNTGGLYVYSISVADPKILAAARLPIPPTTRWCSTRHAVRRSSPPEATLSSITTQPTCRQ